VGPYVVDFYCAAQRLAVELDGESHASRVGLDSWRTEWLGQHGIRVLRFTNRRLQLSRDAVLETILRECEKEPKPPG
jgi:very-short-patch-repair endonuclease